MEELVEKVIDTIDNTKHKVINAEELSSIIKEAMGDDYEQEKAIAVKSEVASHERIEFFKEGTCIQDNKFYYSAGNWIAIEGVYDSPIQAKRKLGIDAWETQAEED